MLRLHILRIAPVLLVALVLAACGGAPAPAPAAAPVVSAPAGPPEYEVLAGKAKAAEEAGRIRQAFDLYMNAVAALPDPAPFEPERQLRESILKLAARLDPPPDLPEAAERYATRAQIMFSEAKNRAGFEEAADEYEKGLRVAPWSPILLFNYALVLEKLEKYDEAIANMRLYLMTAPADANQARVKIYELEYRAERPAVSDDTIHPGGARKFGKYLPPSAAGDAAAAQMVSALSSTRGIISNYSDLSIGRPVMLAAVAPGVRLSEFHITLEKFSDLTRSKDTTIPTLLESRLRSRLATASHSQRAGQLNARAALVAAAQGTSDPNVVNVEVVFRNPAGKAVAKLCDSERGSNPEDAVTRAVDAIGRFVEDNPVVKPY